MPKPSESIELQAAREKFDMSPNDPGAAIHLAKQLAKSDRATEAVDLSRPLAFRTPPYLPAVAFMLRHARTVEERRKCADLVLERVTRIKIGAGLAPWITQILRNALIARARRSDWLRVEPLLVASDWAPEALTATRLVHGFVCNLAEAAERCNSQMPALWRITLEPDAPILVAEGGKISVNLAHLKVPSLAGMTRDLLVSAIIWMRERFGRDVLHDYSTDAIRFGPDVSLVPTSRLFVEISRHMAWSHVLPAPARLQWVKKEPENLDAFADGPLLRAGKVELHNIAGFLADPEAACDAAFRVAVRAQSEDLTVGMRPSVSEINPELDQAVCQLFTNAGWYAKPETARAAYFDWAERYIEAFRGASIVNLVTNQFPPIAAARGFLRQARIGQFNRASFEKAMHGRRVVVVSAFADLIEDNFRSGRLQKLLADVGSSLALAGVATVAPPMSVWPFRPHGNWSESYAVLRDKVLAAVDGLGAEVVIGACGCYGVPLMAEIARLRPGIATIYSGQVVNACFGVLTRDAASHSYWHAAPYSPHWVLGDLPERYPHFSRIDGGRYVGRPTARTPISF